MVSFSFFNNKRKLYLTFLFDLLAERWLGAFDADIIRIQPSSLIRRRQGRVAKNKGSLASKLVNSIVSLVAPMDQRSATRNGLFHAFVHFVAEDLNTVRIVVTHFRVPFVLFLGISETISNTQTSKIEFNSIWFEMVVSDPNTVSNAAGTRRTHCQLPKLDILGQKHMYSRWGVVTSI